ncbi:hypothetical protein GCM10010271_67830 [Streptomyces kurssanovii]|nr:hypothetical protein GCM10010271_67830 [Streptomyces kurssanovii]
MAALPADTNGGQPLIGTGRVTLLRTGGGAGFGTYALLYTTRPVPGGGVEAISLPDLSPLGEHTAHLIHLHARYLTYSIAQLIASARSRGGDMGVASRHEQDANDDRAHARRLCRRGHVIEGDNEYVSPDGTRRECRACIAHRSREARRRKVEREGRIPRGPHGRIPDGQPKSQRTQFRERARRGETQPVFRYPWNENFFDSWSDDVAWLLGIIWSDGHLDRGNRVSVSAKDRDLIEVIARLISQANGVRPKNGGRHWSIGFTSPHAAGLLRSLGLMPAKSHIIAWPVKLPQAYEAAFVRGLLDGDGSVLLSKRRPGQQRPDLRVSLCSASEELTRGFLDWCARNGLRVQHYTRGGVHTALILRQASLRALHTLLYPMPDVPCLARKRETYDAWMATPRAPAGRPRADSQTPRSKSAGALPHESEPELAAHPSPSTEVYP